MKVCTLHYLSQEIELKSRKKINVKYKGCGFNSFSSTKISGVHFGVYFKIRTQKPPSNQSHKTPIKSRRPQ